MSTIVETEAVGICRQMLTDALAALIFIAFLP